MDRREAIEWLEQIKDIYIRGGDEDFDRRRKEALDLAIESLQEKHQLSGKTSTISEKESVEGDAEAATTTDCNYTCSDCKHQDKAYEQEPCHSCFNNDGAGYEPDTDCISRQEDMGEVSDGYHTFNQLYHQRAVLFATIVNQNKDKAWKSWKHEDGKFCFDKNGEWFIVGIDTPEGSYTYR